MSLMPRTRTQKKSGFTLIELIITIIIMGFAAIIITPFITGVAHGPDPVIREKAIALGQALMDEILSKRWDENTPNGGGPICTTSESGTGRGNSSYTLACPEAIRNASAIGIDAPELFGANQRALWDDVDDYHNLNEPLGGFFYDQTGTQIPGTWSGFSRQVRVEYIASNQTTIDATTPAFSATSTDTKRIVVTVTSSLGETFQLVAVACNF